jgi:hypothetical protein
MYGRCSAKSVDAPKRGERCSPPRNPSTTDLARSSRLEIRERILGSRKRWRAVGIKGYQLSAISDQR